MHHDMSSGDQLQEPGRDVRLPDDIKRIDGSEGSSILQQSGGLHQTMLSVLFEDNPADKIKVERKKKSVQGIELPLYG